MGKTKINELMEFATKDKKEYNGLVGFIGREYGKVEASTLKIAFALHKIYEDNFFKIDGYKNIYDCGADKFNLGRGTVSNMINIVENFGKRDETGSLITGKDGELAEGFEKYTFSKLCLLVSVPKELVLEEFYPSMTCKEIREKKTEIANRIKKNDAPNLIEAEEEKIETGMNEPEDTSTPVPIVEDKTQEMFMSIVEYADIADVINSFNVENFCDILVTRLSELKKTLPKGANPSVEFGLIIR